MKKQTWLDIAEIFDSFRIIPRLLVFTTVIAYIILCYYMIDWAMVVYGDLKDIPVAIAGLIGTILTTLSSIPTLVIRQYFNTGRNWTKNTQSPPDNDH